MRNPFKQPFYFLEENGAGEVRVRYPGGSWKDGAGMTIDEDAYSPTFKNRVEAKQWIHEHQMARERNNWTTVGTVD